MKNIALIIGCGLVLAFSSSCVGDEWFDDPNSDASTNDDSDGDNFSVVEGDCDDNDPDIYPGAPEQVNCLDDNCNGIKDEGTVYSDGVNKTNEDRDKDGYCPSTGDWQKCEGDPKRYPGQEEDGGNGSKKPNGIDDNCNGIVDEGLPGSDIDKDGFTVAGGDCNDRDPNINPGAIEVEGMHCKVPTDCPIGKCYAGICRCQKSEDCSTKKPCIKVTDCTATGETCKVGKCTSVYACLTAQKGLEFPTLNVCRDNTDNDCDNKIDELPTVCDDPTKLNKDSAPDYAKAIELCDTDHVCGMDKKCPGKLKCVNKKCSRILASSFNAKADKRARAIASVFAQKGPFKPKAGKSFVVLSSGVATYDPYAKKTCVQSGTNLGAGNTHKDPDPKAKDKTANDYIHLELQILVPTNAQTFDFDFHFFSAEYPDYVGTQFNDTFWVQLKSKKFNGNISFDKNKTPIRINNAFFTICDPYPPKPTTTKMCDKTKPSSKLTGTGYAKECYTGAYSSAAGGSTDWLHTTSPVTPGETITLTFSVFDKGDHILDSAVLIDNFRWKLKPAIAPITGPK